MGYSQVRTLTPPLDDLVNRPNIYGGKRPRKTVRERFEVHLEIVGDCWLWTGTIDERGEGVMHVGFWGDRTIRNERTQRVAWTLYKGPVPEGYQVRHSCQHHHCCNPDHLFLNHDLSDGLEYHSWNNMRSRCYNASHDAYPYYGGRGIVVCDRWRSNFAAFYADVGPRPSKDHSIDRIDNDGNYEPGNVRWATRSEQQSNKRPKLICKYGHALEGTNILIQKGSGLRNCRECGRNISREFQRRLRAYMDHNLPF